MFGSDAAIDASVAAMPRLTRRSSPSNRTAQSRTNGSVALVMAIEVDLLVLDEPTLGLDILFRKSFYDRLLNDYFDHNTSIVISTHQVEEIDSLLTHLIFIDEGRIVLSCSMEELSNIYCEVLVGPENIERALQHSPIHTRDMLGKRSMIFENASTETLGSLGEVHTPSVADLFVAKMQKG